jgi:enamine deaminase RidA (YjgF/YER057c/UK114 family)
MSVYARLEAAGITLPPSNKPAATYVMLTQTGSNLHLSGHIARKSGEPWRGKVGLTMTTEEGAEAARCVAIDLLSTLHDSLGDLNRIQRIIKVVTLVHSSPDYEEQHLVANGASQLLLQAFDKRGQHARSAFGVAQLPFGVCVEIEMIVELDLHYKLPVPILRT